MMKVVVVVACVLFATLAAAQERNGFQVTIENLSGGSELPSELSPVVWSVHSGVTPLFNPTRAASDSLQVFAEDALPLPLLAEVESGETNGVKDAGIAYYHRQSESGALPGQTFQFGVMGERGDRLSFVTQFCETNDRFYGSSQDGFSLYDENGAPQSGFVDVVLYDAGTEINERPGSGVNQKARQPRDNVGQNENSVVLDSLHNIDEFVYPATKTVIRVRVTACVTFRCKLDNLSAGSSLASPLAPLAFAVHLQENVFFTAGERASAGLEAAAEDGNVALAIEEAFNQTGTLFVGSTPPVAPSSSIEFDITVPQGARLSFVSMLVATNDRFYAPFPRGVNLFDNEGPVDGAVTDIELWDAGTELNERPGQGANQPPAQGGPSEPNGFVKHALADRDTFTYPLTEEVIALSVAPLTGQGFTSSSFEQKLNVNFVFSNMIKPQA